MTLEDMSIPIRFKDQAARIILRIEQATGMLDATMAGGIAEGFLLGLACSEVIASVEIDQLEELFSDATDQKMLWLRKNA